MNPDPEAEKKRAEETGEPGATSGDEAPPGDAAAPPATPTGLEEDDGSVEIEFIADESQEGIELADDPPGAVARGAEPEPERVEEAPASADQQRIASLTRLVSRGRIEMDLVQSEIGELKKERAGLQKEVREKDERMLRAQADFAAVRAQLERKLEEQRQLAGREQAMLDIKSQLALGLRRVIEERYREAIAALYAEGGGSR